MINIDNIFDIRSDVYRGLLDLENRDLFKQTIKRAIDEIDVLPQEISHNLGVSCTTVGRWKNGNAIPLPAMRYPVYRYLRKTIEEKIHILLFGSESCSIYEKDQRGLRMGIAPYSSNLYNPNDYNFFIPEGITSYSDPKCEWVETCSSTFAGGWYPKL